MKVSALALIVVSMITATMSYADTTASGSKDNHGHALWLMLARRCDEPKITEYADLTEEHFLMTDENGKNIYQIALQIHKDTRSIPCAKMAGALHRHAAGIRKKLDEEAATLSEEKTALCKKQRELNERISKFDSVMSTFEATHV